MATGEKTPSYETIKSQLENKLEEKQFRRFSSTLRLLKKLEDDTLSEDAKKELQAKIGEAINNSADPEKFRKSLVDVIDIIKKIKTEKKEVQGGVIIGTAAVKQDALSSQVEQNNDSLDLDTVLTSLIDSPKTTQYTSRLKELQEKVKSLTGEEKKKKIAEFLSEIFDDPTDLGFVVGQFDKIDGVIQGKVVSVVANQGGVDTSSETSWYQHTVDWLFDSDELNEIQAIDIDGKVESIEEFNIKLKKLIEVIKKSKGFKKLPTAQQTEIITGLQKLGSGLEKQQNKTLDFLDAKINALAKQIEDISAEPLTITIEGKNIQFASKKEAFEFVKNLKSEAESEFQSFLTDLGEAIGSGVSALLWNPGKFLFLKNYSMFVKNLKEGAEWYDWAGMGIAGFIIFLSVGNYYEKIYRRVVLDQLATKFGVKTIPVLGINLYLEEDTKKGTAILGEKEQLRQITYNNRLQVMNILEKQVGLIPLEDRLDYKNALNDVRRYISVDTKTFGLRAEALIKEYGIYGRNIKPFIPLFGGGFLRNIDAKMQKIATESTDEIKNDLSKGVQFLYDDSGVDIDKDGIIEVKVEAKNESQNLKDIRASIDTIADSQIRENVEKALNEYLSEVRIRADSEEIVKARISTIINNQLLARETLVNLIDKDFFTEKGWEFYTKKTKGNISKLKEASRKLRGASILPFRAKGNYFMMKLRRAIMNGDIQLNMEQYTNLKQQLAAGKKPRINGLKTFDFSTKYGVRVGLGLNNVVNLEEGKIEDIIDTGKDVITRLKQAKEVFTSDFYTNGNHIIDLDNTAFPTEETDTKMSETQVEKMRDQFKTYVEGLKYIDKHSVKLELIKIYSGYLDQNYIREKLKAKGNAFMKKNNVTEFVNKLEKGEYFIEFKDLERLIDALEKGENIAPFAKTQVTIPIVENGVTKDIEISQRSDTMSESAIKDLESKVSQVETHINVIGEELGKQHFKNTEFLIPLDIKDGKVVRVIKDQFNDTLNVLAEFYNQDNSNFTNETGSLFQKIENGTSYTRSQFFENLKRSLDLNITDLEKVENFNAFIEESRKGAIEVLEGKLQNLQGDDRIKKIKKLLRIPQGNKYESSITEALGEEIANFVAEVSNVDEENAANRQARANHEYDQQRNNLEEVRNKISNKDTEITKLQTYLQRNNLPNDFDGSKDYYHELKNTYSVDMGGVTEPTNIVGTNYIERSQEVQERAYERINQLQEEKFNLVLQKKNIDINSLSEDERRFLTSFIENNIVERLKAEIRLNNLINRENVATFRQFRLGAMDLSSDLFTNLKSVEGIYSKIKADFGIAKVRSVGTLLRSEAKLHLAERLKFHIDFHGGSKIKLQNVFKKGFKI